MLTTVRHFVKQIFPIFVKAKLLTILIVQPHDVDLCNMHLNMILTLKNNKK